jgi:hypothetical protein
MSLLRDHSKLLALCLLAPLAACGNKAPIQPGTQPGDTAQPSTIDPADVEKVLVDAPAEKLTAFKSTKELARFLEQNRKAQERRSSGYAPTEEAEDAPSAVAPAAPAAEASSKADDAGGDKDESITNTQEQGVDEGGIVKTHGDHLVVLRRGRLFTVDVGDRALRPISALDVSPAAGHDAWYDEMLIHGDTIVVVGFSYQVGATELGLFNVDRDGKLSRRDTFFLRSNDYYSSRNYASRLLGDKLVFYMPFHLGWGFDENNPNLPGVAHWDAQRGRADDWDLVIDGNEVFKPVQEVSEPVLHTVVTCDLGKQRFSCDAQGIIGPWGRSFYVSQSAVYVWTHDGWSGADNSDAENPPGAVYRLPLDGGRMGALRVWGAPVDQFSFKESGDGHLNVLVRADSKGDAMWSPEFAGGDIAMMRVPVQAFANGVRTVSTEAFHDLPEPDTTDAYAFQNRFVGDFLLYGMGSGWGHAAQENRGSVFAYPFASGRDEALQVPLPHGTDRIEALGSDAVVIGSDGRNLHFSALELGARPGVAGAYVQRNASQGELRSHGFFYKPEDRDSGTLGLPIRSAGEAGASHLVNGSAEVLFLDVDRLNFRELGALASDPRADMDDRCTVSCVDWYGNARPIFYKGRVFALLGYELVEGRIGSRSIREVGRANLIDAIGNGRGDRPVWKKG